MAKNTKKMPPASAQRVVSRCPTPEEVLSVPRGSPRSSQPSKAALCLGKAAARAGPPMRAGCGIPRCR